MVEIARQPDVVLASAQYLVWSKFKWILLKVNDFILAVGYANWITVIFRMSVSEWEWMIENTGQVYEWKMNVVGHKCKWTTWAKFCCLPFMQENLKNRYRRHANFAWSDMRGKGYNSPPQEEASLSDVPFKDMRTAFQRFQPIDGVS